MNKYSRYQLALKSIAEREIAGKINQFIPVQSYQNNLNGPFLISTVNTQHLRGVSTDADLFQTYFEPSALFVIDGNPIRKLLKSSGLGDYTRLTGVDLVSDIINKSRRIYFIGSNEKSVREMYRRLNVPIVDDSFRIYSGEISIPMIHEISEQLVNEINNFKPNIILIALGFPKQELTYAALLQRMSTKENLRCLGIGGSVDILGGTFTRAPLVLQQLSLEWAWRLLQSPRSLAPRYLRDFLFLAQMLILKKLRRA